jgi:Flp pilus assembly protein TadD
MDEATQAKQDAEKALEKGRAAQAIEAAERSVALDPTDAEAWLILGAGYDQRGAFAQARRCFATCAKVATRGPRRECAALLR